MGWLRSSCKEGGALGTLPGLEEEPAEKPREGSVSKGGRREVC